MLLSMTETMPELEKNTIGLKSVLKAPLLELEKGFYTLCTLIVFKGEDRG